MQRDFQANEIDWVFCWRTSTGAVRAGARDTGMNGKRVVYQPGGVHAEAGLRTVVRRPRTSACASNGLRLDRQGAISRMSAFSWGYVARPSLVPAVTMHELRALRDSAHAAVHSGEADEWALAAICLEKSVCWAIHIRAVPSVVTEIAKRVHAPWTLDIREKADGSWVKGAEIFCRDLEGRVIETLEADTFFGKLPLPSFASDPQR